LRRRQLGSRVRLPSSLALVDMLTVSSCERENQWLEESQYAVDLSILPRGGSRRRKSMEPRALVNMNGSLTDADAPRSRKSSAEHRAVISPSASPATQTSTPQRERIPLGEKDVSTIDTPLTTTATVRELANSSPSSSSEDEEASPLPANVSTPTGFVPVDPSGTSPTTPYYLSQGAKLVQQTCPPKQTQRGLFPLTGRIEDQPDEGVRARLEAARRKSLVWKPRIGSPLGL